MLEKTVPIMICKTDNDYFI